MGRPPRRGLKTRLRAAREAGTAAPEGDRRQAGQGRKEPAGLRGGFTGASALVFCMARRGGHPVFRTRSLSRRSGSGSGPRNAAKLGSGRAGTDRAGPRCHARPSTRPLSHYSARRSGHGAGAATSAHRTAGAQTTEPCQPRDSTAAGDKQSQATAPRAVSARDRRPGAVPTSDAATQPTRTAQQTKEIAEKLGSRDVYGPARRGGWAESVNQLHGTYRARTKAFMRRVRTAATN